MSSPDDDGRSDDFPNLDYAPKWARDIYRQGSPDTARGEPQDQATDAGMKRAETVDFPQPSSQRAVDFIIAVALGAVIGLLATGELRFAPGSGTKTIELTSSSDNSKMPEQLSSPSNRLAIAPTVEQPANGASARVATVGGASEPAPTARDVTDSEIRFGISVPFTGPAKELGQNIKLGIETSLGTRRTMSYSKAMSTPAF
jgi:hypothetical protein